MSASEKRQKIAAISQIVAGIAANNGTVGGQWAANQAKLAGNYAQAEAEKEAQKEAEKKAKGKGLGGILGTVASLAAAPFTAGMSIPAAAAISGGAGALGSTAGQLLGGGDVDFGQVLQSGATGAVAGGLGAGLSGGAGGAAAGAKAGASGAGATGGQVAATAGPSSSPAAMQASNAAVKSARADLGLQTGSDSLLNAVPKPTGGQISAMSPEARGAYFGRAPVYKAAESQGGGYLSRLVDGLGNYAIASQMMGGIMPQQQSSGQLVRDPRTGRLIFQQQNPYGF